MTTSPGIQHVLFDLGNVLVRIDFDRVYRSWATSSGLSFEEVRSRYKQDEAYMSHERGEISGHDYHRHVCQLLGTQLSFEDFLRGWNAIFGPLIAETFAFIGQHQGRLKFSAFSNTNELHFNAWSVQYARELRDFERIFCSHQLGMRKPEARAFEKVLSELEIDRNTLVFVDDLAENIQGAERVGIRGLLFQEPAPSLARLEEVIFRPSSSAS